MLVYIKGKSILVNGNSNEQRGSIMCGYCNGNELIFDHMKCLYNMVLRTHSKLEPFANQPLFDHLKLR